ncbi:DNA-binding protein [Pasteurella multocida]|uniref:DNA-binding protein n=2 Tax=Pasteurella multocida TaxID=747 RepID=UPI0007F0FD20|nr:DNA-binding protein [Pasteurella multocida]ANJ91376.1 putative phage transposase [Pasteurella multocida subsp. multocida HB01]MDX3951742.1 DNA-binding protein [Pasteurella multocida]MDX3980077.1 DNA-binding protein [Pasteurella multocida]MDY0617597.1 ci repressor-like protein [Pasteurella multocida]MEB3465494.1 DNA-binding protein [Pasteurella multocida]
MIQEWYEIKDLIGVEGLPTTVQGLTKKAKLENWQRRRITGIKGKAFEYYVGDMPLAVQQVLGFKTDETNPQPLLSERIDHIMAVINSLEAKVKELEEPTLDSLTDTLDQAEKRLVRWFRQCNKDRQAMLLSSAEVLADMSLKEQKESSEPLENCEVA